MSSAIIVGPFIMNRIKILVYLTYKIISINTHKIYMKLNIFTSGRGSHVMWRSLAFHLALFQ